MEQREREGRGVRSEGKRGMDKGEKDMMKTNRRWGEESSREDSKQKVSFIEE